ncbi:GNAT family N-acetyltransferase [Niallia sp. Krafla_26]|uniref:GNAT family N-acetyltransferase n=1 Tax=Niallia sp. Krafla_26 TaxID=3064703 RepID=UPI003D172F63
MIRNGKNDDLPSIMRMVEGTIKIMKEEQNDQWDETYPTLQTFEQDIQNGSLFVLEENGYVIGSITVDLNLPDEYSSHSILWRKNGKAFTFHRLVVHPAGRGQGIASKLISYAEEVAIQNEIPYLKIDTYSLNKKAQALFEKNGFCKAGEMAFQGKKSPFYCYDKILG